MQLRQAREEYRSVPVRLDALRGRMQLRRLYDARRHLFFIGYDGANARMSEGHYDLLASESVMLSFAAIMAGEAPRKALVVSGPRVDGAAAEGAAFLERHDV